MLVNSSDAFRYGCEGMMAIHWRTAAIAPNITALARAGWDINSTSNDHTYNSSAINGKIAGMDAYWDDWGRGMFGGDAGAEAGRIIQKFDGSHPQINALIAAGAKTADATIAEFFAPLHKMELLRPRIQGAGNLDRFDYWFNLIRATHLRVKTWVLADRLAAKINEVKPIPEAGKKAVFARKEILPLRVDITRNYEDMITAFVNCAKSPGEIGTIASIESGSRDRIVTPNDAEIAEILGEPLPAETAVSTAYHGSPRIFVSAKCTQMHVGESQEIRAFVLSSTKCTGLNLYWRPMGEGSFKKVVATHRARQAYRVTLPAQPQGSVEYCLEAILDNGQKVLWPATAPAVKQTSVVW